MDFCCLLLFGLLYFHFLYCLGVIWNKKYCLRHFYKSKSLTWNISVNQSGKHCTSHYDLLRTVTSGVRSRLRDSPWFPAPAPSHSNPRQESIDCDPARTCMETEIRELRCFYQDSGLWQGMGNGRSQWLAGPAGAKSTHMHKSGTVRYKHSLTDCWCSVWLSDNMCLSLPEAGWSYLIIKLVSTVVVFLYYKILRQNSPKLFIYLKNVPKYVARARFI